MKKEYLQNFHLGSPPPKIRIENENVRVGPMPRMLLDGLNPDDPIGHPVVDGVIGVGFH